VGRKAGISEEQLRDLPHYEGSDAFSALDKLVLRYAERMTRTPVEVPDPLFNELRNHLGEAAMVELTGAIAWENFRARFDHAFGIEAQGFSEGAYCPLPEWPQNAVAR